MFLFFTQSSATITEFNIENYIYGIDKLHLMIKLNFSNNISVRKIEKNIN